MSVTHGVNLFICKTHEVLFHSNNLRFLLCIDFIVSEVSSILISLCLVYVHVVANTVLLHFLAQLPLSECAPVLEYRLTEVNCSTYDIGTSTFSVISQHAGVCAKKRNNTVLALLFNLFLDMLVTQIAD